MNLEYVIEAVKEGNKTKENKKTSEFENLLNH